MEAACVSRGEWMDKEIEEYMYNEILFSYPTQGASKGSCYLFLSPHAAVWVKPSPNSLSDLLPISTNLRIQGPWSVTLPYHHMVQQPYPLVFTQISWRIISTQKCAVRCL